LLSETQREHFKQVLETRISELDHALATAEQETREGAAKHADPADQAASEYERQSLIHQAATARQMLKNLTQALERMRQRTFGRVRRMRRRHRTEEAGSHSVGAVLRQVSGSKGEGLICLFGAGS
jgi:DnaK suppressor DksA-like protein